MKNEGISKTIKSIYPYVVIAALASLYTVFGIKKGSKNYLVTRETIDSNGNDKIYNEYDSSYALDSGKITHISRWNLNENNEYERITKIYDINNWFDNIVGSKGKYKELNKLLLEVYNLEIELMNKKIFKKFTINKIREKSRDIMEIIEEFNNNVNFK